MIGHIAVVAALVGVFVMIVASYAGDHDEHDRLHEQRVDARMALYPTTGRDVQATPRTPPVREIPR